MGFFFCNVGNAFKLLGNYPQAKSNYLQALSLFQNHSLNANKCFILFKTIQEKFLHPLGSHLTNSPVEDGLWDEKKRITNQSYADILRLVSEILMVRL